MYIVFYDGQALENRRMFRPLHRAQGRRRVTRHTSFNFYGRVGQAMLVHNRNAKTALVGVVVNGIIVVVEGRIFLFQQLRSTSHKYGR
jgi:hypothetical protein